MPDSYDKFGLSLKRRRGHGHGNTLCVFICLRTLYFIVYIMCIAGFHRYLTVTSEISIQMPNRVGIKIT